MATMFQGEMFYLFLVFSQFFASFQFVLIFFKSQLMQALAAFVLSCFLRKNIVSFGFGNLNRNSKTG